MAAVTLSPAQLFDAATHRVYVADSYGTSWDAVPYLRCVMLTLAAAPAVERAVLQYELGAFTTRMRDAHTGETGGPAVQAPLSLNRKCVKVEILTDTGAVDRTWYGQIEVSAESWHYLSGADLTKTGVQTLHAVGLSAVLDRVPILTSVVVDNDETEPFTVGRGIGFNVRRNSHQGSFGNRAPDPLPGIDVFAFGRELSQPTKADELQWTAEDALKYLIRFHFPDDITWTIEGVDVETLNWYTIAIRTDRRSVKDVLDELIDRRRIVGYWVYGEEEDGQFYGRIRLFTFTPEDIDVGEDRHVLANTRKIELNALASRLVEDPEIVDLSTQSADTLIVEGEPIVTVCSMQLGSWRGMVEGWDLDLQHEYVDAVGSDETENTSFRQQERFHDVFARFVVPYDFEGLIRDGMFVQWKVALNIEDLQEFESSETGDLDDMFYEESPYRVGTLYPEDGVFLSAFPYRPKDSAETDPIVMRPPFAVFKDGATWAFADQLNAEGTGRTWACSLGLLHDRMGVRLHVNHAGGQQLIANADWEGAGATPEAIDPDNSDAMALSFRNACVTVAVPWEDRVTTRRVLRTPVGIETTQVIRVADAHLWFELRRTILDIDEAGGLVESDGRILRDDRARLHAIADAAAQWYGADRQALRMTFNDITPGLEIGDLVTALTTGNESVPINTPVTGLVFNLMQQTTRIETSYVEADFS